MYICTGSRNLGLKSEDWGGVNPELVGITGPFPSAHFSGRICSYSRGFTAQGEDFPAK